MKLLFIINPIAGKGKTKDAIPIIHKFCNDRGILYEVKETHFPGNATDMVLDAITHDYSAIVAVGGDGTVLEGCEWSNWDFTTPWYHPTWGRE